jgi:hypothetical protein
MLSVLDGSSSGMWSCILSSMIFKFFIGFKEFNGKEWISQITDLTERFFGNFQCSSRFDRNKIWLKTSKVDLRSRREWFKRFFHLFPLFHFGLFAIFSFSFSWIIFMTSETVYASSSSFNFLVNDKKESCDETLWMLIEKLNIDKL